jgi:hypothetical protein
LKCTASNAQGPHHVDKQTIDREATRNDALLKGVIDDYFERAEVCHNAETPGVERRDDVGDPFYAVEIDGIALGQNAANPEPVVWV